MPWWHWAMDGGNLVLLVWWIAKALRQQKRALLLRIARDEMMMVAGELANWDKKVFDAALARRAKTIGVQWPPAPKN